jgi:hypothetical protein
MRQRLVTVGLYAGALGLAGLYLAATHREEVRRLWRRLANCTGCQRRREALARMMHQAQEAVGVHEPDDA